MGVTRAVAVMCPLLSGAVRSTLFVYAESNRVCFYSCCGDGNCDNVLGLIPACVWTSTDGDSNCVDAEKILEVGCKQLSATRVATIAVTKTSIHVIYLAIHNDNSDNVDRSISPEVSVEASVSAFIHDIINTTSDGRMDITDRVCASFVQNNNKTGEDVITISTGLVLVAVNASMYLFDVNKHTRSSAQSSFPELTSLQLTSKYGKNYSSLIQDEFYVVQVLATHIHTAPAPVAASTVPSSGHHHHVALLCASVATGMLSVKWVSVDDVGAHTQGSVSTSMSLSSLKAVAANTQQTYGKRYTLTMHWEVALHQSNGVCMHTCSIGLRGEVNMICVCIRDGEFLLCNQDGIACRVCLPIHRSFMCVLPSSLVCTHIINRTHASAAKLYLLARRQPEECDAEGCVFAVMSVSLDKLVLMMNEQTSQEPQQLARLDCMEESVEFVCAHTHMPLGSQLEFDLLLPLAVHTRSAQQIHTPARQSSMLPVFVYSACVGAQVVTLCVRATGDGQHVSTQSSGGSGGGAGMLCAAKKFVPMRCKFL
jgi:hypothetical protein